MRVPGVCVITSCSKRDIAPETKSITQNTARHSTTTTATRTSIQRNDIPKFKGRSICVYICGVDSRLNEGVQHADANHVIRFWLDTGAVEIIDIPRDTQFDVCLDSNMNNLANLRAMKGRTPDLLRLFSLLWLVKP